MDVKIMLEMPHQEVQSGKYVRESYPEGECVLTNFLDALCEGEF